MSVGSSLSGVNFSGLSSGIDTESIISRLMQIEALPIQRLQQQQAQLTQRQGLLNQFKAQLTSFSTAAGNLGQATTYNPITSTSSNMDVATITSTSGAVAGSYQLAVSKLAQAHKISSTPQTSATQALGLSGSFTVNGKGISVAATDTLTTIAQKINGTGSGVAAGIIDGGAGNAYLTLTSSTSGAASKIQIGDLTGGIAASLGIVSGAATLREPITGGATSIGFANSSTNLSSLLNAAGVGTKSFTLNGTAVSVDLDNTNLQGLANAINAASTGVTASVRSVTVNGTTQQKLDLTGLTTFDDSDHVLESIGVVQRGFGNEMVMAQDAEFKVDGISLTSATNTVSTVIPGTTLTLLKANVTTPETSTITLTRDTTAVKQKMQDFADAYNGLLAFVKANSSFDQTTFATGGLFGDSNVAQVEASLSSALFSTPTGLSGTYTNLTQIGFGLDSDGNLTIDDTKLSAALSGDISGVSSLFRATGTSANSQISYLSSSNKTKASSSAGYSLVITQAATQHTMLGESAQTSPLVQQEILTFNGALFGNSSYDLVLDAGLTQQQVVDKINSDSKLKDSVSASIVGGKLQLNAKKYGTPGVFTVSSNRTAAADTSGLGTPTISLQGLDVSGTINGETAIGSGQVLTGSTGNATTDGLQLMYTGSATGSVGTLVFTKGMSPTFTDLVTTFTDGTNGLLTATDKSLTDEIDGITSTIEDLTTRMTDKESSLRAKFARMEQAISQLQGQQQRLAAMK